MNKLLLLYRRSYEANRLTPLILDYREFYSKARLREQTPKTLEGIIENAYERGKQSIKNKGSIFRNVLPFAFTAVGLYVLYKSVGTPIRSILSSENSFYFAEHPNVDFTDVQGCDEVKTELEKVVSFLKHPMKFDRIGAKLPKGILLEGPPGVGKTLLGRALAGEAGVAYIFANGSSFENMFVGVGSSKVQELFKTAKENAPCVIFIDEIDSLGRKRVNSPQNPYANQTINQLLTELDGFEPTESVIVIGATNKKGNLDSALLRPGRFDSVINVSPPDYKGRQALLKLYLSKVKTEKDIDIDKLAHGSVGYTGADIKNLVNQAAIMACLKSKKEIGMVDLWMARDKILMGPEKTKPLDAKSNLITAYHEAGHAIVSYFTKDSMPIHKVTIIPRGPSGGHTSFLPDKDLSFSTRDQLLAQLDSLMGGRVAEELIFGDLNTTTGAGSDLKHANDIAFQMVTRYGFSEVIGPRVVESNDENYLLSPETKRKIELEVDILLQNSMERARKLLIKNAALHKKLSEALLKYETLDKSEVEQILKGQELKK